MGDEAPFLEVEEVRGLVAEGKERGYLTFEEITATFEEVELTKEQILELHAHLQENGVEIVANDDRPPGLIEIAGTAPSPPHGSPRSTSRSSRAWTRCGSTCGRSGAWSC